MSFSSDLYAYVTADSTIASVIGTRLYPNLLPESSITAWPGASMVYKTVNASREQTHAGDSNLITKSVQFSIFSKTRADLSTVVDALCALFIPLKGAMGSSNVGAAFHVHDSDSFETETRLFHGVVEFEIWHYS
jgi:hypothetical protein